MQDNLVPVFKRLKRILKKYQPPLVPKMNLDNRYDLWSVKEVTVAGKKRKEMFFAALIIQSGYVGFYYMPMYTNKEAKAFFKPEVLRLLKGKSCFHIKSLTPALENQIFSALKKGYALYKKRGWI